MRKAVATNVMILMVVGTLTVGLASYKVYQSYETSRIVSRDVECMNKRFDYCTAWSNIDPYYNSTSKPT